MYCARSLPKTLLLMPLVLAVACGAPDQGEEETMGTPEEAMEAATEEPMEEMPMETRAPVQFTLMLEEMNASGVTGTASAGTQAQSVTVDIELAGAPAGEELPAHIHQGTCASGGSVVAPLSPIQVSDDGDASGSTTLDIGQIPEGEWFVQVHAPDGQPVACADIPAPTGMSGR